MLQSTAKLSPAEYLDKIRLRGKSQDEGNAAKGAAVAVAEPAEKKPATEYLNSGRGGVVKRSQSDLSKGNRQLEALFERVDNLLGDGPRGVSDVFFPKAPTSLAEAGLVPIQIEQLVLKFLAHKGQASGREVCQQIRLPFSIVEPLLKEWKNDHLLALRGSAEAGDYMYSTTDYGRERAKRYAEECTYFGAAPVNLRSYLQGVESQTINGQEATEETLRKAFSDLLISEEMLEKLGPAINSGRGMFLFGEPGNGKTSIAERITRCFGNTVWIPRTLCMDSDIIRLFDPGVHQEVAHDTGGGLFDLTGLDQRWVQIVRPTIVAGGELTMAELEVTQNLQTKICEAPLQLKSNLGTLVIDDFGRQAMPVTMLLNRWIVPLEKRYDFLNLPSGKKIQVPFDQLIIFSTNLEPRDLVDGAFLRRIPYKIEVPDPSEEHFRKLLEIMAPKLGLVLAKDAVDHLVLRHYREAGRPFRNCQPRDLLMQVRNFCLYRKQPKRVTADAFDFAVENYFSMM